MQPGGGLGQGRKTGSATEGKASETEKATGFLRQEVKQTKQQRQEWDQKV